MAAKRYNYKVYDSSGTYIKTWDDVVNDLKFKTAIETGIGQFQIELARSIKDFGENDDVAFNNKVEIRVFDEDSGTSGVLIASGRITRYTPNVDGKRETVTVQCLGFVHRLAQTAYIESSETRFSKTDDPSEMFKDVLDAYGTQSGESEPDYDGSSVDSTGLSETYEFNAMTCLDALKKILELCPSEWYFFIDGDNVAHLKEKASSADHTFVIGKAAQALRAEKNIESVVNRIYFTGGIIYTTYKDVEHATQDTERSLGHTSTEKLGQSFVAGKDAISGVNLYVASETGTPSQNITLSIQTDLNGEPSGEILTSKDITTDLQAASGAGETAFELPEVALIEGDTYWVVLEADATDGSNYYRLGADSATGYTDGALYIWNGSSWAIDTNDLYFATFYPANLFKEYSNAVSISEYGEQAIFKQDERITNEDSMDQIADAILDIRRFPEVRMTIRVMDNNNNDFGYDIESIKPGDTCYIRNLIDQDYSKWDIATWDVSYWDRSLGNIQELLVQIQSVEYTPDHVILELSTRPPRLAETIEQIERDLKAAKVNDNPDAPTS